MKEKFKSKFKFKLKSKENFKKGNYNQTKLTEIQIFREKRF